MWSLSRIVAVAALLGGLSSYNVCATEASKSVKPKPAPSLYKRLGGLKAISLVVDDFIDRLVSDEKLNANPAIKAGRDRSPAPYLKVQVSVLACQVTGGPCKYTGKDMKSAHAGMGITEPEWAEMISQLNLSLAKFQVPDPEKKDFLAIIESTKKDIVIAKK